MMTDRFVEKKFSPAKSNTKGNRAFQSKLSGRAGGLSSFANTEGFTKAANKLSPRSTRSPRSPKEDSRASTPEETHLDNDYKIMNGVIE